MSHGWIGVDFDGTLATYDKWVHESHCGEPIAPMVKLVKKWRAEGRDVRIFTARVFPVAFAAPTAFHGEWAIIPGVGLPSERIKGCGLAITAIQAWCKEHLGEILPITCVKDYGMIELYDDRAVQVRANTGELVGESTRGI
jgi:hypothetical protein